MREFYFFEAHPVRHFHVRKLLFIIERRRTLLAHRLTDYIAIYAVLALTLF